MTSLVVFVLILAGTTLVTFAREMAAKRELAEDSKDVIKRGVGVIATLAALVLGLMVASAKSSYDTQDSRITLLTANVILLDRLLDQYGPGTRPAREALRAQIPLMVDRIWRESSSETAQAEPFAANARAEALFYQIQSLAPQNDSQRSIQSRAIQIVTDIAQTRFLLFAQSNSSIPLPFLVVLVFWLTVVFASFSLFARPNAVVVAVIGLCALSISGSIFLILDLDQPFIGLMAIPKTPLLNALAPLG